jgi:hypothetical protein
MTSREEVMRLAALASNSKIVEDEHSIIVSSMSDEREGYVLDLKHSGYMTMGKDAAPGVELDEGPVFGLWPGLGLVGDLRDKDGKEVESNVMGNPGMTILLQSPETIVNLVQAALSVGLTNEQVEAVMNVVQSMMIANQESHAPSRLVEQTYKMMNEEEGKDPDETFMTPLGEWEEDDPSGLLKVARSVGMPLEERRAMYDVLKDEDLTQNQRMEKAKVFLAARGINLIDYSEGAPKEVVDMLHMLRDIGAMDIIAPNIQEGISAVGISLSEIMDKLPKEKADELRELINKRLDKEED